MSTTTPNLGLFKYNPITDGKETFSIQTALNDNWDIIDEKCRGGLEVCDIGMALYVDETKGKRRYLNGQIIDHNTNTEEFFTRLQQITTLHPSLLCTEEEWQTAKTMSAFGQVGKFVFNYSGDEIVSVRLPRVVNIQGLFDLQNLGMTVKESLPNIRGTYSNQGSKERSVNTATGAFEIISNTYLGNQSNAGNGSGITFNASLSSSTYQDNAPVQQEAIQYPYFIQIATGSETENNIINDIELNNPYSLFDSKYSDHELNNLSWLKSEGQWNAKAVYPTAYDKLLKVYNGTETVEGLSVKLSTETYTDYDFVLNTADETFRLPLKNHTADDGNSVLTLYFYVGETVQNANLINTGRIGEQLANKADINTPSIQAPYIKENYVNGTSGYIVWSNGYCEQWGRTANAANSSATVSLLKAYKNKNYAITISDLGTETIAMGGSCVYNITNNGFKVHLFDMQNGNRAIGVCWVTIGCLK